MSLSTVIGQYWVVPSIFSLTTRHPKLGVDLVVDDDVIDIVRDGIDIAIRTGQPGTLAMVAHPLGRVETCLYASSSYLKRCGVPQTADDLQKHALLSNSQHPVLNQLNFKHGRAIVADGLLRSGNTALIAQMAAEGLGIAHLPVQVACALSTQEELRPVLVDEFASCGIRINAITLPDRQRLPRIRACLDHLMQVFGLRK